MCWSNMPTSPPRTVTHAVLQVLIWFVSYIYSNRGFFNILPSNKSSKGIDDIITCLNFKQKLEHAKFAIINIGTNKGNLVVFFPQLVPQHILPPGPSLPPMELRDPTAQKATEPEL